MKLIAFFCFIGLVTASAPNWQWQSGKEHIFSYSGRLLTGFPKLDSHYSGLGIKCDVTLQVKSTDDIRLSLSDVRFTRVNGKLSRGMNEMTSDFEGSNWRHLLLPNFLPASEEIKALLKIPVSFAVKDGEVKTMTLSGAEQEWSLNFKKALVVLFQTKMETSSLDLEQNTINKESYETKNYWKVSEETIEGVCDVIYQVNEMPEYMVKERYDLFPKMESCPSQKFYEITKTKELDSCKKSAFYTFMKPSLSPKSCNSFKCLTSTMGSMSSVTRYYACGSRSNLVLQTVINEGEIVQTPYKVKTTERLITGTKQTMRLKAIKTIQHELPKPAQPRTTESVMYEYLTTGEVLRSQIGIIPKIPQSELKNGYIYKYLPRHYLPDPTSQETKNRLSPSAIKSELKKMIEEIIRDLTSSDDLAEKKIPMRLTSVVRGLTFLKYEDLKSLYLKMKTDVYGNASHQKKSMFRNIYFDATMVSGTTPAVIFLKEMISSKEMSKAHAGTIMMLLPHHIMTPSKEVFESLMELIHSSPIAESKSLYNIAVLAMSNLVEKACLDKGRRINYPTYVFGDFCDSQSEIVMEKWIPYLTHQLRTTSNTDRRNVIIMALGALSHKDVVPILLPLIEGNGHVTRPSHNAPFHIQNKFSFRNVSRYLSIFAMGKTGHRHPELVLPIVFSVFSNPAENTEIRIAAFRVFMSLNPPMHYLQKVATSSWSEKDMKFFRTVYSSISSMSKSVKDQTSSTTDGQSFESNLIKKCQSVMMIMRKIDGGYPSSENIYQSSYSPRLNIGYKSLISWISDYESTIPSEIFYHIEYLLGEYKYEVFEMGFKMEGYGNVYDAYRRFRESKGYSNTVMETLTEAEKERYYNTHHRMNLGGRYTTESRRQAMLQEEQEEINRINKESHAGKGTHNSGHSTTSWNTKNIFSNIRQMEFDSIKHKLHSEWVKVIEHLKLETHRNGPLASLIYMQFFDDVSYFNSISDITTEVILRHAGIIMKETTSDSSSRRYLESKICGKTPVNFQKMMTTYNMEFLFPTDMGFPIMMEARMPTTLSIRGHVNVHCNTRNPSVSFETKVMSASNFHVHVGTFCPFTKEALTTGITQDRVINLPISTKFILDAETAKLKVIVKPEIREHRPIDLVYFRTMPFTSHESYYSFTPKCLSQNVKRIHTTEPLKNMNFPYGSTFGINLESSFETESRYMDKGYIYQLFKLYDFSFTNMLAYEISPITVSASGNPSLRYHKYTLKYNPMSSSTKEIEMTFSLGVATKYPGQETLYHTIGIKSLEEMKAETCPWKKAMPYVRMSHPIGERVHALRQGVLQKIMSNKLELSCGVGIVFRMETLFKGSHPKSYVYQISGAAGTDSTHKMKWHMETAVEPSSNAMKRKVCMTGHTHLPTIPVWDIDMVRSSNLDFTFKNTIGFGHTCEESMVKMYGSAKVSEKQRRYSSESPIAAECGRLIQQRVPGALTSSACEKTLTMAKMIDEIDVKMEYVNAPPSVKHYEGKIARALYAAFWPHVSELETFSSSNARFGETRETLVRFFFDKRTNTISIVFNRPEERVHFRHIPLGYPLNVVFPLVVSNKRISIGRSVSRPVCHVEKNWLRTYDNRSLPLKLDDCYHLVTGDCSGRYRFGVLTRSLPNTQAREIKVFMNKTEVRIVPTDFYSESLRHMKIIVNGSEIILKKNIRKTVHDEVTRTPVFELYKYEDNVIRLTAHKFHIDLKFNGERLSLLPSRYMKNKLCGICGNYNHQKLADLSGPKKCVYSKPELEIASYRISTPHCSLLETGIKERLEIENHRCAKYKEIPTEVYKSFMSLVGKCNRQQHMTLERGEELCFSVLPVTQCGAQCSPKPRQLVSKKIAFHCIKNGRVSELYRDKVTQGQILPELKSKTETFISSVLVPQSCVSVTSGHPMVSNSGIPSTIPSGSGFYTGSGAHGGRLVNVMNVEGVTGDSSSLSSSSSSSSSSHSESGGSSSNYQHIGSNGMETHSPHHNGKGTHY